MYRAPRVSHLTFVVGTYCHRQTQGTVCVYRSRYFTSSAERNSHVIAPLHGPRRAHSPRTTAPSLTRSGVTPTTDSGQQAVHRSHAAMLGEKGTHRCAYARERHSSPRSARTRAHTRRARLRECSSLNSALFALSVTHILPLISARLAIHNYCTCDTDSLSSVPDCLSFGETFPAAHGGGDRQVQADIVYQQYGNQQQRTACALKDCEGTIYRRTIMHLDISHML